MIAAGHAGAVIPPGNSFPPEVASATAAATAALRRLQERWPQTVELGIATQASIYHSYPYLFLKAFPGLAAARVEPLSLAASLFADSLFVADDLMDEDPTDRDATTNVVRIQAMQFEGYQILYGLFPAQARFWDRFRDYLSLYAHACITEKRLAAPEAGWGEITRDLALRMAKGKSSLAKFVVAGLGELAGDETPIDPLTRALDRYYIARQMVDDLSDWRQDLERGYPSLLLARVAATEFAGEGKAELARQPERTSRAIYFGGHARHTVELALAALAEGEQLTAAWPDLLWHRITARLRAQCRNLLTEIDRIVGSGSAGPREGSQRFQLSLPAPEGPWKETAWASLGRLLERFRPREAAAAAPGAVRWHRAAPEGEALTRAIVAEALCDADALLEGRLRPVIAAEAKLLLHQWLRAGHGGLPLDADHLGRILRLLLRLGWREVVEEHCRPSLAVFLDAGEPAGGPDEVAVAQLLTALHLWGSERFHAAIESGASWLESRQRADGSWQSPGYRGPYLPTAACLELLAAVRPGSAALHGAAAFLRRVQLEDGGWGCEPGWGADAASTALALLGLARIQAAAGDEGDLRRAERGRARLLGLPPLGVPALGGALTAAFTLQASLLWHRLGEGAP